MKTEKPDVGLAGGNTAGMSGQAHFQGEQDFGKKRVAAAAGHAWASPRNQPCCPMPAANSYPNNLMLPNEPAVCFTGTPLSGEVICFLRLSHCYSP